MAVSSCAKKGSNRVILEVILLFWRLTRTVELVNGEEERRRGPESEVLFLPSTSTPGFDLCLTLVYCVHKLNTKYPVYLE
jgi:hypothetical protein